MWTNDRFAALAGIEHAIVQGPFGGGNSTPDLAAAVSNAGGLGSFGAVGLEPPDLLKVIGEIRARTDRPFNLNLWVPIPGQDDVEISDERFARALRHVAPYYEELGLPLPSRPERYTARFEDQVAALLDARPPVFSFVMGVPDRTILRDARSRGIKTLGTATTVEEAVAIEEAGADAVVASGSDAGGHRSTFLRAVPSSLVGTMSLVPQVAREVGIPVVAAGGIADGRGIAAARILGADAVQIGSAFLATPESGAPPAHKSLLGTPASRGTRLTQSFSGRHARGIENELMAALSESPDDLLPYPMQYWLTGPIRRAAGKAGRRDLIALWAGQNAASARPMPAGDLVRTLAREAAEAVSPKP